MPSDLLGTYVVMESPQGRRTFEFQKGPIFANLVLADQINRGTPKTQSALLEAMEGQEVTVARESFQLPQPFLVVATQNPVEMEGTFPLPEPQLDRFLLKVHVGPPGPAEMEQILDRTTEAAGMPLAKPVPPVRAAADGKRLLGTRAIAWSIPIDPDLRRCVIRLVAATHPNHADAPSRSAASSATVPAPAAPRPSSRPPKSAPPPPPALLSPTPTCWPSSPPPSAIG